MVRHGLTVINNKENNCDWTVTKRRVTQDGTAESAIDLFIVSDDLESVVDSLLLDEKRKYFLTKIVKNKRGITKQESDHNVLVSKLKFSWNRKRKVNRMEIYNLKNKECQTTFKELTNEKDILSSI